MDLNDGQLLISKLKEFSLGINVEKRIVEDVTIDRDWFDKV